ncbi:CDP-glycerol glycerophosphotransferase family protein [Bacillus subtilis subsp. subtilis]|uniref:glycosyltransferase n=1 Tax=Bacillus subtilis TaxID=1423 RepID=UPI000CD3197F|nr:glycosyltransferase [Bacillus subtilis]AYK58733.1 glycosyltransferase [Bacillus subtilis subsp. subtilis]AYK65522.1 glycosyltransferase [Bacillus subtilis subsp. subtilis]MBP3045862.1 CDP-glycerol glycerophosphotransferase family protein [Bacillus subtilis subsp. subtilis]MEC0322676.1 glycosyltransferase [Bacillus subtilis]POD87548.1 CDP-glycerol glycerophosphotransferase [Bacillus subtilis subsp. subtilis]
MNKKLKIAKRRAKFLLEPFKTYTNNKNFKRTVEYTRNFKKNKIDPHIIFYESYHGKAMNDNPYAIFKYLVNNEEYKNFTHVWALNDQDNPYANKYKGLKNVRFVKVHSEEYIKYLTKAKYLINNVTFPTYFQKKDEQIYINTWHGTPLKTLGKDMEGPIGQHKNIQRNFLHSDYILSPNKFTSEKLIDSHDLEGLYNGEIIEEGYPRMDLTFNTDKEELRKTLENIIELDPHKKIILYAPTWRGEVGSVSNINEELFKHISALNEKIPDDYQLILKVHTLLFKYIKHDEQLMNKCIPDCIDTNELLSLVDILITDYSSIFFDYMATNKPILYFMYDKEQYLKKRGMYLDVNTLAGPICKTTDELAKCIKEIESVQDRYQSVYQEMNEVYIKRVGDSTQKIVDIIFKGKQEQSDCVFDVKEPHKKNILIYCGGFLNNGITSSAINLLNNIDYEKYNVIVIDKGNYDKESSYNISRINEKAKRVYRVGSMNLTIKDWYLHGLMNKRGYTEELAKRKPEEIFKREINRMLGNARIDIAVDFSGYVPFWTMVMSLGEFPQKSIYQHNDMLAETNKIINGKYKHKRKLGIVFSLYKCFNKIVSVAKHTRDLNAENLAQYVDTNKMVYVHNSLNVDKIKDSVENHGFLIESYEGQDYIIQKEEKPGAFSIKGIRLPKHNEINFVNMGRLSPEKDQEKLIKAFSQLSNKYENLKMKLYIIGDGILKETLNDLVGTLGLEESVIFTGQMKNPFFLINKADCFVLSSNHEGQPMVLLETLVLNKPIIATDIAGSRSILEDGYGTLAPNDVDGLFSEMEKFVLDNSEDRGRALNKDLNYNRRFKRFDYENYNHQAMKMFYREVCSEEV